MSDGGTSVWTECRVRRAGLEDAEGLVALVRALNVDQGDPADLFGLEEARRDLLGKKADTTVFVAEAASGLVGYAMITPAYETGYGAAGFYLSDLYVEPQMRRRGLGRALVARCAREARSRGHGFLWWTSFAWNEAGQAFYRRLGAVAEPVVAHALFAEAFAALADEGDDTG